METSKENLSIEAGTDWREIQAFYHSLIDAIQNAKYHPMWQKDIYPAPEDISKAVDAREFFVGRIKEEIAAAMVVNRKCNEEYADAKWNLSLDQDDFMVIHMLGVHPRHHGKGYAKQMVRYALDYAKASGVKAVRLDVLKGNVPAERLYPSLGFSYVDTIELFYEDTGRMSFELFEYQL